MAIHIDVVTRLDERAIAANASALEAQYGAMGVKAGEAFNAGMAAGGKSSYVIRETFRDVEQAASQHGANTATKFMEALNKGFSGAELESGRGIMRTFTELTKGAGEAGTLAGAAFVAALGVAIDVGIMKVIVDVGEQFAQMHRDIVVHTAASGAALEEMSGAAERLVGTLDTSMKNVGTDFATLATRLGATGEQVSTLVGHVEMLRDRWGSLDVQSLAGALSIYGLSADEADAALASLNEQAREHAVLLPQLVSDTARWASVSQELGLSIQQEGHLLAELSAHSIDSGKAMAGLEVAEKQLVKSNEDRRKAGQPEEALPQYIQRAVDAMRYYHSINEDAKADEIALTVFGQRRWAEAAKGAEMYVNTVRAGAHAFDAAPGSLDEMANKTKELSNIWNQFTNEIKTGLAPLGGQVLEGLKVALQGIVSLAHELQGAFKGLPSIIKESVEVIMDVANPMFLLIDALRALGLMHGEKQPASDTDIRPGESTADYYKRIYVNAPAPGPARPDVAPGQPGGPAKPGEAPVYGPPSPPGASPYQPAPGQAPDTTGLFGEDKSGKKLPKAPEIPYPAEYGAPPEPGETPEHYRRRMANIQAAHEVAEKAARVDQLEHDNNATEQDLIKARNDLQTARMHQLETEGELNKKEKEKIEVPYPAGYGAPPRPGESERQYGLEQSYYEAQHKVTEARAKLQAVEADTTHTAEDLTKAQNDLATAQRDQYKAAMSLNEAARKGTEDLGELGAKIDKDFGAGRGLPGIVENLIKLLANLAFAPVFGAMRGAQAAMGYPGGKGAGSGLIGMLAAPFAAPPENQWVPGGPQPGAPAGGPAAAAPGAPAAAGGGAPGSLAALLGAQGASAQLIRLIEAFNKVEGPGPGGVPSLGFTGAGDLQSKVNRLMQQIRDRASVSGAFPEGGGDVAQAQWIARVVGQAGVGDQPPDYVQRVVRAMQGAPTVAPSAGPGGSGGLNLSTIPVAAQQYANDCIDASARIILSHSGINMSEDQLKAVIAPGGTIESQAAGLNRLDPAGRFVAMAGSGGSQQAMFNAIKASIDAGVGSILNVAPGSSIAGQPFSEGHFIAATGYNPDGTINLSDTARGTRYTVSAADAFQATRGRGIVAGTGTGPGAVAGPAGVVAGGLPGAAAPGAAVPGYGGATPVFVTNWPAGGVPGLGGPGAPGGEPGAPGGEPGPAPGEPPHSPEAGLGSEPEGLKEAGPPKSAASAPTGGSRTPSGPTPWDRWQPVPPPAPGAPVTRPFWDFYNQLPMQPSDVDQYQSDIDAMRRSGWQGPPMERQLPHMASGGAVPIIAHAGEHVLTASDVAAMGGQAGVYAFRAALHDEGGTVQPAQPVAPPPAPPPPPPPPAPPPPGIFEGLMAGAKAAQPEGGPITAKPTAAPTPFTGLSLTGPPVDVGLGPQPGKSMVGAIAPSAGYGAGFQITGGGLVGLLESLPSTAVSTAISAAEAGAAAGALFGGAIEDLPRYDLGGAVGGADIDAGIAAGEAGGAAAAAGAGAGAAAGSAGGASGISTGAPGSIFSAAINIGMQELNAGITALGQAGGALVGGLQQTFGPGQFAQTKLGQQDWITRLVGGIVGAQPQLPNLAGPKQPAAGLTPEQAASAQQGQPAGEITAAGGNTNIHNAPLVNVENYHAPTNIHSAFNDLADRVGNSYTAATNAAFGAR